MPLFHCQTLEGYDCGGASNFNFRGFHQKRKVDMGLENQLEDFELEQRVNFPKRPCLWPTQGTPQNLCPDSGQQQQRPALCSPLESQNESSVRQHQGHQQHAQSHALSHDCFHNTCHHKETKTMPYGASHEQTNYLRGNKACNEHEMLDEAPSSNSLPRNMGSNNLAAHFLSRVQWRNREVEERQKNCSVNNNVYPTAETIAENMDQGDEEMSEVEQDQNYADTKPYQSDRKQHIQRERAGQAMEPSSTEMDSDTAQYMTGHIPISSPQNIDYGDTPRRCPSLSCSGLKPSPVSGRLHCHCSASWRGMYGIDSGYGTDYY